MFVKVLAELCMCFLWIVVLVSGSYLLVLLCGYLLSLLGRRR